MKFALALASILVALGFGASQLASNGNARPCNRGHPCPPPPPTTTTPPGYLFDDEFSGSSLDTTKWWATPWCSTSPDDQQGCYNTANAFLNGQGQLVLRASNGTMGRPYDFARIQTFREGGWPPPQVLWQHSPPFRMEVRAKFAPGAGLWTGIWASSNTDSAHGLELDTQEFRGAVPTQDTCHTHIIKEWGAVIDTGFDGSSGYHNYWMNYYSDHVVFGVDGLTCGQTILPASPPEMIRLTNQVGVPGTWGGMGGPPPASAIPADMLVDYVRVTAL